MLLPAAERSLQRRYLIWQSSFSASGISLLIAFVVTVLIGVGAWLWQRQQPDQAIWAYLLMFIGILYFVANVVGQQQLRQMQRIAGHSPPINREVVKQWAKEKNWPLRQDQRDFVIIDSPKQWYASVRQVTVLFQGRDLWLHVAGRHTWGSLNLLSFVGMPTLRRQIGFAIDSELARRERDEDLRA